MSLKVKHPVFLEAFKVEYDGGYYLDAELIINAIQKFQGKFDTVTFGFEPGFFANEGEVKTILERVGEMKTVTEAIDSAKERIGIQ